MTDTQKVEEVIPTDDCCKIFVGNLCFDITDDQLAAFFGVAGKVVKANVITRLNRSMGYGFVTFETQAEAEAARELFHQKTFNTREINVELARSKDSSAPRVKSSRALHPRNSNRRNPYNHYRYNPRYNNPNYVGQSKPSNRTPKPTYERKVGPPSKTSLFIANLHYNVKNENLKSLFEAYNVVDAHVVVTSSGRSRGYGFVELATEADQQKALQEMNNATVSNRSIIVRVALEQLPEEVAAEPVPSSN